MPTRKTYAVILIALLVVAAASYVVWKYNAQTARQQMIHETGANVMPFDLNKTLHEFKKTGTGGVQSVVVRDPADTQDLSLIRMHLQMEATDFAQGNYADPSKLHGNDMPGLFVLEANYSKMKVSYSDIANGAQIDFESQDAATVAALHTWFDAQVSDHGSDAVAQ